MACLVARHADVASLGGGFKGDEASYVGLAASIGLDHDFTYGAIDYQRFQQWYGGGPQGIFLKRGADGQIYFGKAFVYGVLAAPFALASGVSGLFVFNLVCLAIVMAAGYTWLRPKSLYGPALAFTVAFVFASITPLYAFWLTSDTLNLTLVFLAFACTVAPPGEPQKSLRLRLLGMLLLAAAIYSKPLNAPLALPLALATGSYRETAWLGRLAGIATGVLLFFIITAAITGEMNYQGGDRKTFYGAYPYDTAGHTFDSAGIALATETLQTPVGGEGRMASLPANAWYFLVGRHFGLLPFGWPWLVVVCWWAVSERRKMVWQWMLLAAIAAASIATLVWLPYTWAGGGGPVGNRYFLSLAASLFFLVPRISSFAPAVLAALGLLFVWPSLASPFVTVKQPWRATQTAVFNVLPFELSNASEFPIILDRQRGRVPQGRAPTVFIGFIDDRSGMGDHGWIAVRAGTTSNLLVRSPLLLEGITIGVKSVSACAIGLTSGRAIEHAWLGLHDRRDLDLHPSQVFSRDSFVFIVTVDSQACGTPIEVAMQAHVSSVTQGKRVRRHS
jgi:hypothetical protein